MKHVHHIGGEATVVTLERHHKMLLAPNAQRTGVPIFSHLRFIDNNNMISFQDNDIGMAFRVFRHQTNVAKFNF